MDTNNPLAMSDEEFLNSAPLPLNPTAEGAQPPSSDSSESSDSDLPSVDDEDLDEETEDLEEAEEADSEDETESEEEDGTGDEEEPADDAQEGSAAGVMDGDDDDADSADSDDAPDSADKSGDAPDYEAEYKRLMAPFKANGREMQVKNVDEAIQLMQMGANYHKKMAALKPAMKTMKLLEKHDLLDAEKLGYLIDLHKKNPDAVKKLVQDSGIDPLDIDDEAPNYQPTKYEVSDAEMALEETIQEIQDSPTFSRTVEVVLNGWDEQSRSVIATQPQLLSVINAHMANGIYDKVSAEVERERALGRLNGLSDIEAYKAVGDRLHEEGALNVGSAQSASAQSKKVVARKSVGKSANPATRKRKQAASPSRSSRSKPSGNNDFNPLAMSDEEFERQFKSSLI